MPANNNHYKQDHITAREGYLREKDAYVSVLQDFVDHPKNIDADYPAIDKVIELRERGFLQGIDVGTPTSPGYMDLKITFPGRKYLLELTSAAVKE